MKRLILIILISFSGLSLKAQPNLDSLWSIWNDQTQPDSSRLKAMDVFVSEGYLYSQPDSAFYYAQLQYKFAQSKGLKADMADALITQGISFDVRGEYAQALKYYQSSLDINEETGNDWGIASSLGNIAIVYVNQGKYLEALNHLQRSLKVFEEMPQPGGQVGHKSGIATTLNNIGNIYGSQGNYPKALENFLRSLKIREETGDESGIAFSLNNIGLIYKNQSDYPKALDYLQRSMQIYEESGDKWSIARLLSSIGLVYQNQDDYPKALSHYQHSLEISEEIEDKSGIAGSLNNIGVIYKNQSKIAQALDYHQRSLNIYEEIGDKSGIANLLNNIGMLYNKQKDHETALKWCDRGIEISESIGVIDIHKKSCKCLYEAYKALGIDKKALEYYEQMVTLRDSIFNENNTKKLTRLEMQYEFDKKEAATQAEQEKKDAIAVQELKRQKMARNGFIGGFAVVLLFAGVFFVQRNRIGKEKARSEVLLLNILPEETAHELKAKGRSDAKLIDQVSVLFTDFKGFTTLSEKVTPKELVKDLHECFSQFDNICGKYGIEKIKTIGDAYMAAGGLPSPNTTHAYDVVKAALEMAKVVESGKAKKIEKGLPFFEIRIGIHTGPVVAGIVGVKKFQYDIWGDTVNTASRMESAGKVGKVNVSQATYELLKNDLDFAFESRGRIEAKGKGKIEMYFVSSI
jgi:class 3 adenylate cyclase/tetratricopeptide (TPR) repeat protein